jgi:biotin carboxyl carrier protein
MRFDVEIGGVTRHVAVVRTGDGFAVTVDGRTFQIDVARIDGHTLSLLVDRVWPDDTAAPSGSDPGVRVRGSDLGVRAQAAVHDVSVSPGADGMLTVRIGTTPIVVTAVNIEGRRHRARGAAVDSGSGPQRVVAPMPGKVVRVLAVPGEAVKTRQPLVVVEAMKMENELRADRDGTVAEVHAREGLLVEAGALLVVINPGAPAPRSTP